MDVRKVGLFLIVILFAILVQAIPNSDDGYEDTVRWNRTYTSPGVLDMIMDLAAGPSRINSVYHNGTIYAVGYEDKNASGNSVYRWRIRKYYRNGTWEIKLWNKTISGSIPSLDDIAYAVAVDSKGNIYVGGTFSNLVKATSNLDWNLKRFNASGSENVTHWNKTFDVSDKNAQLWGLAVDSKDSVYAVGFSRDLVVNQVNTASNLSDADWLIKKFYFNGSEEKNLWNKSFNSNRTNSNDRAYSVAIDSNDNVYVVGTGNQRPNLVASTNWWIKKFNRSGRENVTHWNKTFNFNSSADVARKVAVDSNNNVYVVGEIIRGTDGYSRWRIQKFYSNGSEDKNLWNKTINAVVFDSGTYIPYSVDTDNNNNVYVAGSRLGGSATNMWWIKKFNSSGRENVTYWNKSFGVDAAGNTAFARAIVVDSANNVTVGGSFEVSAGADQQWWIKRFYINVSVKPKVTNLSSLAGPILCLRNISINASVLDTDMGVVLFQFSNGTKPFNVTATNRSGKWEVRVNTSRLVEEGSGVIRAQANDTRLGKNFTQTTSYNHDCTAPTISLSESSSTETSLSISISTSADARTCTSSQGTVSGSGSSQSIKASGLNSGTSYSFSVTCGDEAGNRASKTNSFSTAEAGGSDGEGGDSGDSSGGEDSTAAEDAAVTDESIREPTETGKPSETAEGEETETGEPSETAEGEETETGEGEGSEGGDETGEGQAYGSGEVQESAVTKAVAQAVTRIGEFFRNLLNQFVGTGGVIVDSNFSYGKESNIKIVSFIVGLVILFSLIGYGTYRKYKCKK